MTISIRVKAHDESLIPLYHSAEASGADLYANIQEPLTVEPGKRLLVPTGLIVEIPPGFEMQIRPRSGLAARDGIGVLNSPGTIDSDYRGEILVILINLGDAPFIVEPRMRIAQAVLAPVIQAVFELVPSVSSTVRGEGGFGHTGR